MNVITDKFIDGHLYDITCDDGVVHSDVLYEAADKSFYTMYGTHGANHRVCTEDDVRSWECKE